MLSDNIKNYRKKNGMSQDELAERLGVSRQSISLWETGQTQPTIDNIIALSKIFNISSDMLLGSSDNINNPQDTTLTDKTSKKKTGLFLAIAIAVAVTVIIGAVILAVFLNGKHFEQSDSDNEVASNSVIQSENSSENSESNENVSQNVNTNTSKVSTSVNTNNNNASKAPASGNVNNNSTTSNESGNNSNNTSTGNATDSQAVEQFDLFSYCKKFAIEKGTLNGDYCIYQQPSANYGGYDNEYFSISYWSDSNMVEFCLHCPLSETYSHNFYLRMRGGYNKKYEYLSSKYYRDTGESLRSATGYIDPAVFYDGYPISCDKYEGSSDGQNEFMEESRVGICDLIRCLKEFVKVENMECDFSDFDFVNF